jgi:hypothetical protein
MFFRLVTTASGKLAGIAMGGLGEASGPRVGPIDGASLDGALGATRAPVADGDGLGSHAATTSAARARAA